jgi:hypothetical protein
MEDAEISKLLEGYEKIFKMFREHMHQCHTLQKKVLQEFDFDE